VKSNNTEDALIAEVAIEHGRVLLTADRDLAEVAKTHGCKVYYHPA
jgi:predicted nucleic acid-binding protein